MKLVPSSFASGLSCQRRVVLLAPALSAVPHGFADAIVSPDDHEHLFAQMQRLRGRIYLEDGAIREDQLTADGRHQQSVDAESWHLLAVAPDGVVQGCARYRSLREPVQFGRLGVAHSAMAIDDRWGVKLRDAVRHDIEEAQARGVSYVEVGGWALTAELRCSTEALRIALATWALSRVLGGSIGITTATRRHCSASILRKIGGRSLIADGQEIPHYFDPSYGCEMEILRFDSERPNQRFDGWIEQWVRHLLSAPVLCRSARPASADHQVASTRVYTPALAPV
jgi:hypothetical protein